MGKTRRLASVSLTCLLIAAGIGAVSQTASAATLESCTAAGSLAGNDDG